KNSCIVGATMALFLGNNGTDSGEQDSVGHSLNYQRRYSVCRHCYIVAAGSNATVPADMLQYVRRRLDPSPHNNVKVRVAAESNAIVLPSKAMLQYLPTCYSAAAIATVNRQPSLEQCSRQPSLEQCSRQPPLEQ
ncbi:hypothetical protein ACLOJK_018817, partial [Asimina triloba]